jgi:branched-chain amino acid transport system ATP-binding protein
MGDRDITRLPGDKRARMGLARTFQINTLFPSLTPLLSVVLAISEREGLGATWWRPLKGCTAVFDEAHALLGTLRLDSLADVPVAELAYGKQRLLEIALALAAKPRILLLDEPAAGVPEDESGELFEAIAALPPDISVLFIEHDMKLVFRFSRRISVLVGGRILTEGTPSEIGADPRVREVYLGSSPRHHHHA